MAGFYFTKHSELLEQAQEEYRIAKREQEKAKKIEEARIEKARNRERSKMLRWAKAYGSERLRLGLKLGYDCDRLYVTERANVEYPGFIVDYVGEAESYYQINPGLDALKLAKALRGKGKKAHVVFLLTDPQGDEGNDFEPCEAVVIEGFLGEYNLYKLME